MITTSRGLIPALISLLVLAMPANAHHSFAATYLEDREITIEGELLTFMFRNPHSFVHVMAPDENGEMQRWAVEWAAATALQGGGGQVTRETLKSGERVIIVGNPGRNPDDHRMRLRSIERLSDGWKWASPFD